tara:strand:+ start:379 stop:822 length:444 start_codon:yes stop_codon:yes gene_type:complete
MVNKFSKGSMVLVFAFIFVSCTSKYKTTHVTEEIIGTYIYEFPSKELSVLVIKNDSTFNQRIFRTANNFYNKSNSLYQNNGFWSIEKGNKLYFKNWLKYCWLRQPDSILSEPSNTGMSGIYWQKPTKKHKGLISIYDETGYIFEKIH